MRMLAAGALAITVAVLLTGCFGPGEDELVAQAGADFDALVDQAAAADLEVLHTLEVEKPSVESCEGDSDTEHTVFIAAGTIAVQATGVEERDLVATFEPESGPDDEDRWSAVDGSGTQRSWVGTEGITASVTVDDGLLVVAVFSPCR